MLPDPAWLFLSLIPSGIGFILSVYGTKQANDTRRGGSAIDARTTRHAGYATSQHTAEANASRLRRRPDVAAAIRAAFEQASQEARRRAR